MEKLITENKRLENYMYEKYLKRVFDFISAILLLVIISPIFIMLAILVKFNLGSPIIFKQCRPGKNCKIFKMFKFRSMTNEKDKNGKLLPDEMRLTKFGKWLRATSLDELPELINIIKGDMSVVGPRPQLVRDMVFFNEEQMKRQIVYPGLTGLAQICGRNNVTWEEKFKYDLDYIEDINFLEDMRIIYRTVFKIANQDDISTEGMETAEDLGDYLLRIGKINSKEYEKHINISKKLLLSQE